MPCIIVAYPALQLFETGVDEMSWDDLSRARDDWPPVRDVTEYRRKAYKVIRGVIEKHPALDKQDIGWGDMGWAVFMGFEHERIHIETSSVLIREVRCQHGYRGGVGTKTVLLDMHVSAVASPPCMHVCCSFPMLILQAWLHMHGQMPCKWAQHWRLRQ